MSIQGGSRIADELGGEGIPTYATVADMEAAVAISELVDGDVAFVTAAGVNYFVDGGAVYPVDDALVEVATIGDLPGVATEGDLAVDRTALDIYRYESGSWVLKSQPLVDYSTFTELFDARDAGDLAAGTVYRVRWSGDAYAPDGEYVSEFDGVDFVRHPFDSNTEYPAWLWGASDWTLTDGSGSFPDGVFSQDGDGRPQLSSSHTPPATGFTTLVLSDRFAFYRPRRVQAKVNVSFATRSSDDRTGIRLLNRDDRTQDEVLLYFRYSTPTSNDGVISVKEAGSALTSFVSVGGGNPFTGSLLISVADAPLPNTPLFTGQIVYDPSPTYSEMTRQNGHQNWQLGPGYAYVFALYATWEDPASVYTLRTLKINSEEAA